MFLSVSPLWSKHFNVYFSSRMLPQIPWSLHPVSGNYGHVDNSVEDKHFLVNDWILRIILQTND